ncbi:Sad1 / UNC family C-protein [Besnoitia besnoiti]|uniref:Sad1 / UNC family C-protein n=1 Tax=Besnoitia besnoiti TaxID=94643 RepID=A0A2A9MQ17_BESBE|nr:Sad1 / UNC family C-protein [Besnoitia besnoiti]PFH38020.1 Sad1 / UNC family C-protein [Besnoitia besnoiti]
MRDFRFVEAEQVAQAREEGPAACGVSAVLVAAEYERRRLTRPVGQSLLACGDAKAGLSSEAAMPASSTEGQRGILGDEVEAARVAVAWKQFGAAKSSQTTSGGVDLMSRQTRMTNPVLAREASLYPEEETYSGQEEDEDEEEDEEGDGEEEDEEEEDDSYEEDDEPSPLRAPPPGRRSPRPSASLCFERQPLPRDEDPANPAPPPPRRVSLWGSLWIHARRSLPFFGCDGVDGSLPPTPKPPAYDGEELQQLGASLLSSLVPSQFLKKDASRFPSQVEALWREEGSSGGTGSSRAAHAGNGAARGESEASRRRTSAQDDHVSPSFAPYGGASPLESAGLRSRLKGESSQKGASYGVGSIHAYRVGALDAPDVAALLWAAVRRRASKFFLFFSLLSVALFAVYRQLSWLGRDPEAAYHGEGGSGAAAAGRAPSGASAWLLEKEMQKLRRELEEEREALSDYRERMQLQLKKHVSHLTEKVQQELQSLQHAELSHMFERLQKEGLGSNADEEDEEAKDEKTQQLASDVDAVQSAVRGLEKRNEELEMSVRILRLSLEELAKKQEDGATQALLTQDFGRKVEELHTHLVVEEEQQIDWALESLGGRIVIAETAPPLMKPPSWASTVSAAMWSLVQGEEADEAAGAAGFWAHKRPAVMLQPDRHAGSCYAFLGGRGNVTIQLPTAVYVTSVALDDVASELFTASAPRRFRVWGFEDPRAASSAYVFSPSSGGSARTSFSGIRAGERQAATEKPACGVLGAGKICSWLSAVTSFVKPGERQVARRGPAAGGGAPQRVFLGEYEVTQRRKLVLFEVKEQHPVPLRKILFEFVDNFGHPYTCIYRLRVHGEKAVLQTREAESAKSPRENL